MSINQRLGAVVVALFAIAFTRAPTLVRLFNPVMRRLLVTRLPAGPNVLLKVRGRKTGLPRAFPVAFLYLGERSYIQGASGGVDSVHNLRSANECVIVRGGHAETFEVTELDSETGGRLMRDLLAPFPRSRLIRAVVWAGRAPARRGAAVFQAPRRRDTRGVHRPRAAAAAVRTAPAPIVVVRCGLHASGRAPSWWAARSSARGDVRTPPSRSSLGADCRAGNATRSRRRQSRCRCPVVEREPSSGGRLRPRKVRKRRATRPTRPHRLQHVALRLVGFPGCETTSSPWEMEGGGRDPPAPARTYVCVAETRG
jgi:hypothetical protein